MSTKHMRAAVLWGLLLGAGLMAGAQALWLATQDETGEPAHVRGFHSELLADMLAAIPEDAYHVKRQADNHFDRCACDYSEAWVRISDGFFEDPVTLADIIGVMQACHEASDWRVVPSLARSYCFHHKGKGKQLVAILRALHAQTTDADVRTHLDYAIQ